MPRLHLNTSVLLLEICLNKGLKMHCTSISVLLIIWIVGFIHQVSFILQHLDGCQISTNLKSEYHIMHFCFLCQINAVKSKVHYYLYPYIWRTDSSETNLRDEDCGISVARSNVSFGSITPSPANNLRSPTDSISIFSHVHLLGAMRSYEESDCSASTKSPWVYLLLVAWTDN